LNKPLYELEGQQHECQCQANVEGRQNSAACKNQLLNKLLNPIDQVAVFLFHSICWGLFDWKLGHRPPKQGSQPA
jgi:hypothetical protein